jgi:plastocyanin
MRIMTRRQAGWLVRILVITGSLTILALLAGVASANTLTVTNTGDSGSGSLRQAILDASAGDTINFNIPGGGQHTITLTSGQLTIDKDLTIQGPGAGALSISGNSQFRVFEITNGATVTIAGLTITDGSADTGGGIRIIHSTLEIVDSTISGNHTNSLSGGGAILNSGGILTISNSTVADNTSSGIGGGIYNATSATLEVISSTISGNESTAGGGGIRNLSTLIVVDSEISNNAGQPGGAVWTGGGTTTITDSMLVDNATTFTGGGIWVEVGVLTVSNSAISGNTTANTGGGILVAVGATVTIIDSTISGNSAANGGGIFAIGDSVSVVDSTLSEQVLEKAVDSYWFGRDGGPPAFGLVKRIISLSSASRR